MSGICLDFKMLNKIRLCMLSNIKKSKVKHSHYSPMGPEGSGRLLPDSVTSALEGGRLSAIRSGRLYPQEYCDTHFRG
jgi:hypothetical protein